MYISDEMFETLIICSERYALGRRTYIVKTVTTYIEKNLSHLSDKALCCLERDIRKPFGNYYGDAIDEEEWKKTLKVLKKEIKERGIKPLD